MTDVRKTMSKYENTDEYIANFSGNAREKLETLRKLIKELVPDAKEKISYGIPTFTLDGKYFIYIGGYAKHVSIYPIPPIDDGFKKELNPYIAGKGTVRFALDKPLPLDLIRRLVRFAVEHNKQRTGAY